MRSISEDLFNKDIVDEYLCLLKNGKPCNPPSIVIEVVFSGEEDTVALYKGDFNSRGVAESGIKLDIAIDAESFSDEYQDFVAAKSHHGLPIEYYACSWTTFARKSIRPAGIKFKSALVGAGNSLAWPGSKAMVTRIARDVLERSDQIAISQVHRRMRTGFSADQTVKSINEKISEGSVRPGLTFRPVIFLRLHNGRPLSNLNPARGDAPETGRVARLALPFHADLPANSPSPRRAPAS